MLDASAGGQHTSILAAHEDIHGEPSAEIDDADDPLELLPPAAQQSMRPGSNEGETAAGLSASAAGEGFTAYPSDALDAAPVASQEAGARTKMTSNVETIYDAHPTVVGRK